MLIKIYFLHVDDMKNLQVTDSKKCDIDCYNICDETQLKKNSIDTIHGSGQLKNEEIAVS